MMESESLLNEQKQQFNYDEINREIEEHEMMNSVD